MENDTTVRPALRARLTKRVGEVRYVYTRPGPATPRGSSWELTFEVLPEPEGEDTFHRGTLTIDTTDMAYAERFMVGQVYRIGELS